MAGAEMGAVGNTMGGVGGGKGARADADVAGIVDGVVIASGTCIVVVRSVNLRLCSTVYHSVPRPLVPIQGILLNSASDGIATQKV